MATDEEKTQNKAQMDAAAEEAREAFKTMLVQKATAKDVCYWAADYKGTAGYKRLAKILVETATALGPREVE